MTNETTALSKGWKRDDVGGDKRENDYTLSQVNDFLEKSQVTRLAEVVESILLHVDKKVDKQPEESNDRKIPSLQDLQGLITIIKREEKRNSVAFFGSVIESSPPDGSSVCLLSPVSETAKEDLYKDSTLLRTLDDKEAKDNATIYLPVLGTNNQLPAPNTYFCLPSKADLKSKFEKIFVTDQGKESSCTAHVGIALMEYYQRATTEESVTSSEPMFSSEFLYHVTQELDQQSSEGKGSGNSLRDMMRALNKVGVVTKLTWFCNKQLNDVNGVNSYTPTSICYAEARNYRAVKYVRLDREDIDPNVLLVQVKALLLAGLPVAFGFDVDDNLQLTSDPIKSNGEIPLPKQKSETGHAVIAIGYDDNKVIGDCTGGLQIRNSWGKDWGDKGYGWLPYEYVMKGHTAEWWVLLKTDLVDDSKFGLQSKPLGKPDSLPK